MTDACCAPVVDDALTSVQAEGLAGDFKVLADPVRLRLLSIIASTPEGETCACDLPGPLDRSQPTVSHHLSVLLESGLVTREQRGKWAWFAIAPGRTEFVRMVLGNQAATVS